MIESGPDGANRFRLLATSIAGRPVEVAHAAPGAAAHTDGRIIFVSAAAGVAAQRHEVLLQSALIGVGSLASQHVRALRGRPSLARRYLALEGDRALTRVAQQFPLAAENKTKAGAVTADSDESLGVARSRARVDDPPAWFGVIRPSLLLRNSEKGRYSAAKDSRFASEAAEAGDDAEQTRDTRLILKLFENPLVNSKLVSEFLRRLFGTSRSSAHDAAGAELDGGPRRRAAPSSPPARPVSTKIRSSGDAGPAAVLGVGVAMYPEWDVFADRYRPDWCRVVDFPVTSQAGTSTADVARDEVLRKQLSRVVLGRSAVRGRPDGEELDTVKLVDYVADLRSGHSPDQNVYVERRPFARELGVLVLLDVSGSTSDTDPAGHAVHEHQRRACATLAATLEEIGDRVAVYAFRSDGRRAVHLLAVKSFGQRFSAMSRRRLSTIEPSGYTRLGAAIRGAAAVLKSQAGTPNRLLLVLSDGCPYDHGYEGHYAEADTRKALEELHSDGIACLCMTLGSRIATPECDRAYGSTHHVSAATLADLSPRMDALFRAALRELAAPRSSR